MYYYTLQEANIIKSKLDKFCGMEMVYSPNDPPLKVKEIQIQDTGREINNMGNIDNGYYVAIFFEKGAAIMPNIFCSNNGLETHYATKKELSDGERNQIITRKYMTGIWSYAKGNDFLKISINDKTVEINGQINGNIENLLFDVSGHWMTPYAYAFTSNHDFIISYANPKNIEFGKLETQGNINGKYKYVVKLNRVA